MSKRLRFGLDLDGVVYDWHSAARFLLSQWSGRTLTEEELFGSWNNNFDELAGKGANDFLWGEGVERGLFRHGHVRKGAIEFTRELDKIADIVVITHRPRQARQDTLDWLAFHKIPTQEIHLLTNLEPKSGIDVYCLLDDKFENVSDFSKPRMSIKRYGLLWTRLWNQSQDKEYDLNLIQSLGFPALRMSSWQEVLDWTKTQRSE